MATTMPDDDWREELHELIDERADEVEELKAEVAALNDELERYPAPPLTRGEAVMAELHRLHGRDSL